jgi:hypothetical protein
MEVRVRGVPLNVPCAHIHNRTVVLTGRWLKTSAIFDEELVEGEVVDQPEDFISQIKRDLPGVDIFTFAQKLPDLRPRYNYPMKWDNAAVIPITDFKNWWEKRLPQESRKNVRRATKLGVVLRVEEFNDQLIKGIQGIYNETPVRQGRAFWHFGKDFETVKEENETYLTRSEFIGAYSGEELIGFIKLIYVDRVATLIQILCKNAHQDKRPMNALLAHTVELCVRKGIVFLVYGKYVYGRNRNSTLTDFKRRNGFEEMKYPRYYVPVSVKGRLAVKLSLHLGVREFIPAPIINALLNVRSRIYRT